MPIDPKAWTSPSNLGYEGKHAPNTELQNLLWLDLKGHYGAEDVAISPEGHTLVSTKSGALLVKQPGKVDFSTLKMIDGGRPLGIEFDRKRRLWVAIAGVGLGVVYPDGTSEIVLDQLYGKPIHYADDVKVAPDGLVYFSDATQRFNPNDWGGTLPASLLDLMEHQLTGRVIVYDPEAKEARVWVSGLSFANGVTVSLDGKSLLIAETGKYRILKVSLASRRHFHTARKPDVKVFVDNLPGFPDNLSTDVSGSGRYWVGLTAPRNPVLDGLSEYPYLRKIAQRLPQALRPSPKSYGHVVGYNRKGQVVADWQDPSGKYGYATGVVFSREGWWVSNLKAPVIGLWRGKITP